MLEITKVATLGDLEAEIAASSERDVWFFKHSLTCGVSSAARREFETFAEEVQGGDARFCLIEIQPARQVSNALAERVAVRHQSPQVILVRQGEAAWHASHWDITSRTLARAG